MVLLYEIYYVYEDMHDNLHQVQMDLHYIFHIFAYRNFALL